jgi:hypothetical protein
LWGTLIRSQTKGKALWRRGQHEDSEGQAVGIFSKRSLGVFSKRQAQGMFQKKRPALRKELPFVPSDGRLPVD